MINHIILITMLSFFVTLFLIPFWIRKTKEIGLQWKDMNKYSNREIGGSGGIVVVLGFFFGIFIYIAYRVFILGTENNFMVEIFSLLVSVLMLTALGFMDDLLGWRKGGLSKRSRIILIVLAAIPLVAINAGKSTVSLPLFGEISLGIIYPLFLIPIGIVGATTVFNFLAGFNGLEAGQGIILLTALALVSFLTGSPWLSVIALCMVFSLLAFLAFNFYPAEIFPGDALTYPIGGLIAIVSILGNFEKIAFFFFLPYVAEFFLKARGGFAKYSFGKPSKDGGLDLKYGKLYSLNHAAILFMKKFRVKPTEKKVVFSIWALQVAVIILGIIIFREGLFQ
jgi:UDP-N-acetylglucosamine--dolichyl-phosphate N-acetylglucosaminephosphotransferase